MCIIRVLICLVLLQNSVLAHINIPNADIYLEWAGTVSYMDQKLALPFIWTIPRHEEFKIEYSCNNETTTVDIDNELISNHIQNLDTGFDIDVFEQLCKVDSYFCPSLNNRPRGSQWSTVWGGVSTISHVADAALGIRSLILEEIKYTDTVKAQKELEKKMDDSSNDEFGQTKVSKGAIELKQKQIVPDCQKIDSQQKEINKQRDEVIVQKGKVDLEQEASEMQLQAIESAMETLDKQQNEVNKLQQNVGLQQKEIKSKEKLSNLNDHIDGVIEKYNNIYVKLEKINPKLVEFTNEMCNYSTRILSRNLAIEYLSIYWNKYKNVLESSLRGEVNHEMLNFEEFKKLINIVNNIKHEITELDLPIMFHASKYIIVKHDPSAQAIRGVLVLPIILKQKTLPVYRPLILKKIGKPYYKLPDTIALTHLNDRYQIFNTNNECVSSQHMYLCTSDTHTESLEQKTQIEKFLNNEEHTLEASVATYDQNYSIGMRGVYIRSGVKYLKIFNANGAINTLSYSCKANEFIKFEDFDKMVIEGSVISGSYTFSKQPEKSVAKVEDIPILSRQIRSIDVQERRATTVDPVSIREFKKRLNEKIEKLNTKIDRCKNTHKLIEPLYNSIRSVAKNFGWIFVVFVGFYTGVLMVATRYMDNSFEKIIVSAE